MNRPIAVAVANAKGGVGKTSLVANLAGLAALSGLRVLAVDLDPQGNLAHDLGYLDRTDDGRSLQRVLRGVGDPETISGVRPNLDVWCGGKHLGASVGSLIPTNQPLANAVARVGDQYDAVFFDCPPAMGPLVDAALLASDHLLVPVRADHASLHGLEMIGSKFREVRTVNCRLSLLGVVIFDVSKSATALADEVAKAVRAGFAGEQLEVLAAIRRSERAAYDMRGSGSLAHEYAIERPSSAPAANLAGDYASLAKDVILALLSTDKSSPSGVQVEQVATSDQSDSPTAQFDIASGGDTWQPALRPKLN